MPTILEKYPTVKVTYNGQSREQAKTMSSMTRTVGMILLVIFFIILMTFQSLSQTLIIFVVIPFGFVGVGLGHFVMDLPVSMVSFLGYTALIGVLVNDALVFVTTFNDKIKAGQEFEAALFQTGISRFRPIVLTSITTIVGLGPILLERSLGAQLIIPMAVSLAFGLLIVTVIILAMIPSLLVITNGIKVQALSIWEGQAILPTAVEPALQRKQYNYLVVGFTALMTLALFLGMIYFAWYITGL